MQVSDMVFTKQIGGRDGGRTVEGRWGLQTNRTAKAKLTKIHRGADDGP